MKTQPWKCESTTGIWLARTWFSTVWMRPKPLRRKRSTHNLDGPFIRQVLYLVDFLQHDAAGMDREAAGLMGKSGYEDEMLYLKSDTAAYGGEFAKARELTRRAVDSAQRADEKEVAAGYKAEAAIREALVGNIALAKQQAQAALALANGRDLEGSLGHCTWLGRRFPAGRAVGRRSCETLPGRYDRTIPILAHDSLRDRRSKRRYRQSRGGARGG